MNNKIYRIYFGDACRLAAAYDTSIALRDLSIKMGLTPYNLMELILSNGMTASDDRMGIGDLVYMVTEHLFDLDNRTFLTVNQDSVDALSDYVVDVHTSFSMAIIRAGLDPHKEYAIISWDMNSYPFIQELIST